MSSDFYVYSHPRPLAASTMCYIKQEGTFPANLSVLVVKRKESADTYPGMWCFPGGFLEANQETLEECASREMKEETRLIVEPSEWNLLTAQSGVHDDPRGHMINTAFWVWKYWKEPLYVAAGDDVCDYMWVDSDTLKEMNLAFKHNDIAEKLWLEVLY